MQPPDAPSPVLTKFKPTDLERILGDDEKKANLGRLVQRVVTKVKVAAKEDRWPLNRIEVDVYQDPEVANWEYLVVLLVFNSSFEAANEYLRRLYHQLDSFSQGLTEEELALFRRLVYFDIATT